MDDSRANTKIPFRKSDSYLILFLIVALLLVNAILNLLFGQTCKKYAQFYINNVSTYALRSSEISDNGNKIEFNTRNLSSGVYIYRLQVNNKFLETKKMMLLK